jgi:excisionase family DNA binding protein
MQSIPADQNNEGTARITKLLYSRAEAAEELSLSIRTLDTLIGLKRLRVVRVGRAVRIPWDALRAFTRRDHATSSVATSNEETKAA